MFRPDEAQRQRGKPSVQGPFPKSSLPVLSGKVRGLQLPILSPASRMGQPMLPQSGLTPECRRVESVEGQARAQCGEATACVGSLTHSSHGAAGVALQRLGSFDIWKGKSRLGDSKWGCLGSRDPVEKGLFRPR